MASKSKLTCNFEHTDGTKETRNIGNVNPEASNESLLSMANKFYSLQDDTVKTLVAAKRIDTVDLM